MLELAGIPYVGSGVLASAASMDKVTMKKIFAYHDLPQVEWVGLTRKEWKEDRAAVGTEDRGLSGLPVLRQALEPRFQRRDKQGAESRKSSKSAIDVAAAFDRRLIVEAAADAREIEVSVLGNDEPRVSLPGEILVGAHDFYDYEAKYTEGESEVISPRRHTRKETARRRYKRRPAPPSAPWTRRDGPHGLLSGARHTDRVLVNEINTIPGFTPTSVYARLWDASGLPYDRLLDELIRLALERHGAKS